MTETFCSTLIVAAVDDLFFLEKIETTARHLGVPLVKATNARQLSNELDSAVPSLVIFDLNGRECLPFDSIRRIKSDPRFALTRVVGFFSHVQSELETAAREAGCDRILPRSRFAAELPEILSGKEKASRR